MSSRPRPLRAPARPDVGLMCLFLAPSLAQVLLDPIAGRPVGLLFCVASVVPLAWRRTYPAAAAVVGSTPWLIPTEGFLFLGYAVAVVLFFSVGCYVRSTGRLLLTGCYGLAMGTVGVLSGPEEPVALLGAWLVVLASAFAGWLVSRQRTQNMRLRDLTAQLRREQDLVERSAVAEERARIARELHDVVGHEVTLIAIQSEAAASALRVAPERAVAPVEAIRQTALRAGAEMRAILGVLRQDGDLPPTPASGPEALVDLVDLNRRTGMDVTLSVSGSPWESPNVWLAVHRIVQESLTNARRHAPGSPVTVRISWEPSIVEVQVTNPADGPPGPPGFGILGMTERVRILGGELAAGLNRSGEFEVAMSLPAPRIDRE